MAGPRAATTAVRGRPGPGKAAQRRPAVCKRAERGYFAETEGVGWLQRSPTGPIWGAI